jgi:glycosyltransferase involved in cell wall biosynthesis
LPPSKLKNVKKILLVSTKADLSGAPLHVLELAKGGSENGLQVTVVFGEDGVVRQHLEDLGISTHVVESIKSRINIILDLKAIFNLNRIVKQLSPDLIHAHSSKAGMIARLVAFWHSIPAGYTIHGWGFGPGRNALIAIYVRIVEWLLKSITTFYIAVSEADVRLGIDRLGIPKSKISCIHNGMPDIEPKARARPGQTVIMVARNDFPKDYACLIKAIEHIPVTLRCVGRDTDTDRFKKMAYDAIGKSVEKIEFMGVRSDVSDLLSSSNIFVLSSRFEGLPLSIIEAMRAGLPVITSDVGGCSELVKEGINGLLVKAGDIEALRKAIGSLAADFEMQRKFGEASRAIYERKFSSARMVSDIIGVYNKLYTNRSRYE